MPADASFRPESFTPQELAAELRYRQGKEEKRFLTLLVGSGFSRSAGIPTAAEIVAELRKDDKPSLRNAGPVPPGLSEYAFLMGKLGSPKDRAERVRGFVDKAKDSSGRLRINWAHLLLAALAEADLIHRILTINFDPLIVEALSLAGLPIRTFDLNAAGRFQPGLLDAGSVIYLHGQMHNLLLANATGELEKVKDLYPAVLQEAIGASLLLVVGYSGECDPVLAALRSQVAFPQGLRWAHYSPSGTPPSAEVLELFREHPDECQLSTGLDADRFMMELVLEGMKIELPPIVQRPFDAALDRVNRILELPASNGPAGANPVEGARNLLAEAKRQAQVRAIATNEPAATESALEQGALEIAVGTASLAADREALEQLALQIPADPTNPLSRELGTGFLRLATRLILEGKLTSAEELMKEVEAYGVTASNAAWLSCTWGIWAQDKASESQGAEADSFFEWAGEKFAEALRIKPDMHEALSNWGLALVNQAKTKTGEPADQLFQIASEKFAEALRIKPDKHEALYNQAWVAALRGDVAGCVEHLARWAKVHPRPTRAELDADSDFDQVRSHPDVVAFRGSLPE